MNKIIIIGGEGTAVNIAEALSDAINNYHYDAEFLGFANDNIEKEYINGIPICTKITEINKYYQYNDVKFIYALYKPGFMRERAALLKKLAIPYDSMINFIHPLSYVSSSIKLGKGNVILANSTIQNNVILGMNNIINSNVAIEHETNLGNSNFVSAGVVLGSKVHLSNECFIGLNSSVRENVIIEDNVFIGMNSLLLSDCKENEIWYGVPAKRR